jgi:hypothetical protein
MEAELNYLAKDLKRKHVNLEALLENEEHKALLDLSLHYVSVPEDFSEKVVEWALDKYGIDEEYTFKTTEGQEIGKISLTKNLKTDEDETSYHDAFTKLKELGVELNGEGWTILGRLEYENNIVYTVELLVNKKLNQEIDLEPEYLIEKYGFKEGEFEFDGEGVSGEVPDSFLSTGESVYNVALDVFGKREYGRGVVCIEIKSNKKRVELSIDTSFIPRSVTDKEKAVDILKTLRQYEVP